MVKAYAKKFYNSKEWKQIRQFVLMRDNYLCQQCGAVAEEVHHINHVTQENINLKETHCQGNLISLCRNCHCRIHDKDRERGEGSGAYYFDEDGFPQEGSPPGLKK
ncbi:MAG: HNH endonuclease [Peptococcaceae bacterium]|nr:HNH endonuclease [Peptococcaceae bacterium]